MHETGINELVDTELGPTQADLDREAKAKAKAKARVEAEAEVAVTEVDHVNGATHVIDG